MLMFSCQSKNPDTKVVTESLNEKVVAAKESPLILDDVSKEESNSEIVANNTKGELGELPKANVKMGAVKKDNPKQKEPTTSSEITIEETIPEKEEDVKPSHQIWDGLTKKYVSSNGKVNYNGFKNDLAELKKYINYLASNPVKTSWSKNETLAYWFNLYNASTVYLIATNYPISSITKLENGKPWDKKFIVSGDKTYSLNDIENVIVRPKYKEPLVHVAFNCAAVSCPNLLNEAFVPEKLYAQLKSLANKWVNDTSKNKIDAENVNVSQIFDWYKTDFDNVGGVVGFINKYSTTKAKENAKVNYLDYNWNLNE